MERELLRQEPAPVLARALAADEPVRRRDNGNRSGDSDALLGRLERIARRVGVTAQIDLTPADEGAVRLFQGSRPNVHLHTRTGQSANAEGRGRDRAQARISCLMESIERYSAEPRSPDLVRGSYSWLREHRPVIDPAVLAVREAPLLKGEDQPRPVHEVPLMWTDAVDLATREPLLVPAECVFFPFPAHSFFTPSLFGGGTTGLASGATHLEAVVHALHELVERAYAAAFEEGRARVEAIIDEGLSVQGVPAGYELQLFAVRIHPLAGQDVPMVVALLVGAAGDVYIGRGSGSAVRETIERAVTEALQAFGVTVRGGREHVGPVGHANPRLPELPARQTLTVARFEETVTSRTFATLGEELAFLCEWLATLGYGVVLAANLTRSGVDIPVVRVVVPRLPTHRALRNAVSSWNDRQLMGMRYGF